MFEGHLVACTESSGLSIPSISKISGAYGIKTMIIQNNCELDEKVKDVLFYDGPVICEVMTPIELTALPKQMSYKRSDGQMESLPLEYMNPPISEDEMKANMLIPLYG